MRKIFNRVTDFPPRSPLTNKAVRFVKEKRSESSKCPACNEPSNQIALFLMDQGERVEMLSCNCGTLFYPGAVAPDYSVIEASDSFFMRIDQAEGIDSALMPLFSSPDLREYSVIDIGCGLGFTSDFVRFQGRECIAFDPSAGARMSTSKLGISINKEFANENNAQVSGQKLVFCSEVIEHVENPLAFIGSLRAIAGNNGFLIATTPNADFVTEDNPASTIFAMLGHGQHLFLLSAKALKQLAIEAGFSWVHTWTQDERLMLIAGPHSIEISNCFSRDEFRRYLITRLTDVSIDKTIRYRSFGYRLFKELVHGGRYLEASSLWDELVDAYLNLDLNINNPSSIISSYRDALGTSNFLPNPEFYPFNMPILLFLKGTLLIAHNHDRISAKPYFEAAIQMSELYVGAYAAAGVLQAFDTEIQNVSCWALESMKIHGLEKTP